jgi:Ca2+/Na+ antiporter
MKTISKLTILTIIFNFLILIPLVHAIGFIGLFEIMSPIKLLSGNVELTFLGDGERKNFTASFFALVGQIILLIAYFRKAEMQKYKFIYLGLPLLFFSFIILNADLMVRNDTQISFWSGMPFVISAILLLILTIKRHKKANQETQGLL